MKRIHSTNWHFLVLLIGLGILSILLFVFRADLFVQRMIIVLIALFYFLWGIFHHILEKDLHVKIVLEYLSIAIVGAILLLTLAARV